jgi:hypothetical protein
MSTNSLWKRIKSRALSVSTDEVRLERRRIEPKNPAAKKQLENVVWLLFIARDCKNVSLRATAVIVSA